MSKLVHNLKLPTGLNRLTDPVLKLPRIGQILSLRNGDLMVTVNGREGSRLHLLEHGKGRLLPLKEILGLSRIWSGGGRSVIARAEGTLWRVTPTGRKRRLLDLPDGAVDLDISWHLGRVNVVALISREGEPDSEAPILYPAGEKMIQLSRFTDEEGWVDLVELPARCTGLSMSKDGKRIVWREYLNTVPEEASRGEFRGYDTSVGSVTHLTSGAGQIGKVIVSASGHGVIYEANHELRRPITTHTDLWWLPWNGERRNLTGGGRHMSDFGWLDGKRVWVTFVDGMNPRTEIIGLDGTSKKIKQIASSPVVLLPDDQFAFEAESRTKYPYLISGRKSTRIRTSRGFEDLRIRSLAWRSKDGTEVEGVLYERAGTPRCAPLLVSAHGGPAGTVNAVRSSAARYRAILKAGYRVLNPAFRGSKGFGDRFLQANIGCQGEGDLEDILAGIDHCKKKGIAIGNQVGIFGGSYGGYMTLRALAVTDRFQAGVALFGFVNNRWMTLETGDFTYENEYVASLAWPLTRKATKADVFPHLADIEAPLLLLHGDKDPICSLSQSVITYRALVDLGRSPGMVVYPGEGHGFAKRENQSDSVRQTLAWFLKHLPPG